MLKITPGDFPSDGRQRFLLAGRLVGPWVDELRQTCEDILAAGGAVTLDFSQVTYVDSAGATLCCLLRERQVALADCSPFVAAQIQGMDR